MIDHITAQLTVCMFSCKVKNKTNALVGMTAAKGLANVFCFLTGVGSECLLLVIAAYCLAVAY